ncbi:unnamed protein product [Nezara viridula]|uniref:G-protein coupled receptors family 2 profile 2 domain-containing protein n=1 Tax=Nezara viridula TaxID=85310 RepID=A0A9P0MSX8_NEZVI|nr:unnamed protein product [Nezara viridula]
MSLCLVLLWCASWCAFAGAVSVNKCCPDGNQLEGSVCVAAQLEPWAPVIYNPAERGFLPPDTYPESWVFKVSLPITCQEPTAYFKTGSLPPFVIFTNGSLLVEAPQEPFIQTDSYCIDPKGALICIQPDREGRTTVQKCCGHGGIYSETKGSCRLSPYDDANFAHLRVLHKFPDCADPNGGFSISGKLNDTYFLLEDGSLKESGGRVLGKTQYCLEHIEDSPNDTVHVFTCPPRIKARHEDIRFTLYPMGLFLSVFFLAVTLIASCLLPSTYHVLHWRCQTNHVACLLVGDLLLAITQLSSDALKGPACIGIAIAMHFIILAAFFWLNTMCFNIWWTFRDLRPASLDKSQEACRLRAYEIYAWGGPLIIAGIGALMDSLPESAANPSFLRPKFGEMRCWFYGDTEVFAYFFAPIGFLLLMNLTLFAATARELTCGLWKTEVVKSNTERATLGRVCLKLVVVMGITWVADVVSWVVGGPVYVWYFTDLINAMQGVLIFAVVGCQPQVWSAVKRLWCLRDPPGDNANVRSSSSQAPASLGDQSITKPVETLC